MTNDLIDRLVSLGPESTFTLLVLSLLADEEGVVASTGDELAVTLDVSLPTLRKRLKRLHEDGLAVVDLKTWKIVVTPTATSDRKSLSRLIDKTSIDSYRNKNIGVEKSSIDETTVMRRWKERYETHYGEAWSWGTKQRYWSQRTIARQFVDRYGERCYALIDVVIELYDEVWASGAFVRPTWGAATGWVAEQALAYVERRNATESSDEDVDRRAMM